MSTRLTTAIPPMTDPLGKYWEQPPRERILVDHAIAVMTEGDFKALHDYSHSIPTGKYVGKMWKAKAPGGKWYLRWYDVDPEPGYPSIQNREIVIVR